MKKKIQIIIKVNRDILKFGNDNINGNDFKVEGR